MRQAQLCQSSEKSAVGSLAPRMHLRSLVQGTIKGRDVIRPLADDPAPVGSVLLCALPSGHRIGPALHVPRRHLGPVRRRAARRAAPELSGWRGTAGAIFPGPGFTPVRKSTARACPRPAPEALSSRDVGDLFRRRLAGDGARHRQRRARPPRSARPPRTSGALPTRAALRVCRDGSRAAPPRAEPAGLDARDEIEAKDPLPRWNAWAREWEQRVSDLADRCRLEDASGADAVGALGARAAREALLALHRAYAAQVNRFAQEEANLTRQPPRRCARRARRSLAAGG